MPLRVARPARPAICANSAGVSRLKGSLSHSRSRSEGNVIDVKIETHADRVGGDQIIDVTGLEHRNLRITGARAKRSQHHRCPAVLASDQFGNGVNLVRRKKATIAVRRG